MTIFFNILMCIVLSDIVITLGVEVRHKIFNNTRRILRGVESGDSEPFMVYLRPAPNADDPPADLNWLCGGAIIHESYILTSAACIESVKHFYVVTGTHRWVPYGVDDDCIKNGAKKAVWKCVPINYEFDGHQFENIRWMTDDIAVVKVEDPFNFRRRVIGCDFVPKKIGFNNRSEDFESPGTEGLIVGWGSQERFSDDIKYGRENVNSPVLMETNVMLISKDTCKRYWPERYHYIIDNSMICGKDDYSADTLSAICHEQGKCKELLDSKEQKSGRRTEVLVNPEVHNSSYKTHPRRFNAGSGGFCENDHGGPLIAGHGTRAMVVGVISACLTSNVTRKCHGPFLYSSVYKNRRLIMCAIDRENSPTCRKVLSRNTNTQMEETIFEWSGHPDGPAKSENVLEAQKGTKRQTRFRVNNTTQ